MSLIQQWEKSENLPSTSGLDEGKVEPEIHLEIVTPEIVFTWTKEDAL